MFCCVALLNEFMQTQTSIPSLCLNHSTIQETIVEFDPRLLTDMLFEGFADDFVERLGMENEEMLMHIQALELERSSLTQRNTHLAEELKELEEANKHLREQVITIQQVVQGAESPSAQGEPILLSSGSSALHYSPSTPTSSALSLPSMVTFLNHAHHMSSLPYDELKSRHPQVLAEAQKHIQDIRNDGPHPEATRVLLDVCSRYLECMALLAAPRNPSYGSVSGVQLSSTGRRSSPPPEIACDVPVKMGRTSSSLEQRAEDSVPAANQAAAAAAPRQTSTAIRTSTIAKPQLPPVHSSTARTKPQFPSLQLPLPQPHQYVMSEYAHIMPTQNSGPSYASPLPTLPITPPPSHGQKGQTVNRSSPSLYKSVKPTLFLYDVDEVEVQESSPARILARHRRARSSASESLDGPMSDLTNTPPLKKKHRTETPQTRLADSSLVDSPSQMTAF